MPPGAISSVSIRREPVYSANPKHGFWLKEAGFISTLTTAAGTRTKRGLCFPPPATPRRMLSLLPRNSRKTRTGMDPSFSLRMIRDKKLSVCESAGSAASQTSRGSLLGEAKVRHCVFRAHSSSWRSCHDDPTCQFDPPHPYHEVALGRGDTFARSGYMGHG